MDPARRIARALDHIEANLWSPLPLDEVARQAHYSEYHFHRIFTGLVGQPVKTYVRKRRLTEAARRLVESDDRILDLALDCQFESQEAFSRAFKRYHGVNPGRLRRDDARSAVRQPRLTLESLEHLMRNVTMQPRYVDLDAFEAVGLPIEVSIDEARDRIPELWERFAPRIPEIHHVPDRRSFGLCYGPAPAAGGRFEYVAAVPVTRVEALPPGMVARRIEPRRYAVFTHRGPIGRIHETIDYVWGTWLPRSGHEPVPGAPDFELYDERFDGSTGAGEVDLYVPIG